MSRQRVPVIDWQVLVNDSGGSGQILWRRAFNSVAISSNPNRPPDRNTYSWNGASSPGRLGILSTSARASEFVFGLHPEIEIGRSRRQSEQQRGVPDDRLPAAEIVLSEQRRTHPMALLARRREVVPASHVAESLRAELERVLPAVLDLPLIAEVRAVAFDRARDVGEQRIEVELHAGRIRSGTAARSGIRCPRCGRAAARIPR